MFLKNFVKNSLQIIDIQFKEFDLELDRNCSYDRLIFTDDNNSSSFCGYGGFAEEVIYSKRISIFNIKQRQPVINQTYFVKPKGSLIVQLLTDISLKRRGFLFKAKFKCLKLRKRSKNKTNTYAVENPNHNKRQKLFCANGIKRTINIDCNSKIYILSSGYPYCNQEKCEIIFKSRYKMVRANILI